MTLLEFKDLPEGVQMQWLYTDGVYIGKQKPTTGTTLLYQFHSFYVELVYERHRYQLKSLRFFESTQEIEPYLEQIKIGILT